MYPSFDALLGLTLGGVSLHNVLRAVGTVAVSKLTKVAADVESGNVTELKHDAAGIVDFVQTHDPALAKAVEAKYEDAKAKAEDEVAKLRHAAAEELRKLAESVEKVAGVPAPTDVPAAPQAPVQG
jgi:hypothetical protein